MRVFPMLLIEIGATNDESSLTLGFVKGAAIVSTLAGGWLSDHLGSKRIILASFLVSACGMLVLGNAAQWTVAAIAGFAIAFGQGLFAAPLRLLLFESTEKHIRQEALAWLRAANNGAILVANAVAYWASTIGLQSLFLFDAITSFLAVVVGLKCLPGRKSGPRIPAPSVHPSFHPAESTLKPASPPELTFNKTYFYTLALIVASFTAIAELFFVASAALAKIQFGSRGIAVFAQVYMINTGLCMVASVTASKYLRSPARSMTAGMITQLLGVFLLFTRYTDESCFYIAALLQTIGEVMFAATSQFALLNAIPGGSKSGTIYSTSVLLQQIGKMLAGVAAFQIIDRF